MAKFNDRFGHPWNLSLDFGKLRMIKREIGVDLLRAVDDPESLARLGDDVEALVNTIWLLIRDQASALPGEDRLTDEEFAGRCDGQTIDEATRALLEALVDFFPRSRRPILTKLIERSAAMEAATLEAIEAAIDNGAIEAAAATAPGKSSSA